jgi:hypothetical protein
MKVFGPWAKVTSLILVLVFAGSQFPVRAAWASMVRTEQVLAGAQESQAKRERVRRFLSREDVRAQIAAMGVDPREAEARAESLSDAEVAEFAEKLDELPAGQSAVETIIVGVLVVFFVLLITDLAGLTRVYPFVRRPAPQGP